MVTNPKEIYPRYVLKNVEEIIFHIETLTTKKEVISLAQEIKKVTNVGISLKPETDINKVLEVLSYFDTVLVMSVQPGFGGQKFIESSLERVKTLSEFIKKNKLNTKIAIDGGINLDNYQNLISLGVDVLIMGSALFKLDDPNKVISDCHK
jgi:ribulose-phosphate 3-epimerase